MPNSISENFQQHSESIQDIISTPPSWLMRIGIGVFFVILLLIAITSAIIRYPDIVKTQLIISSVNLPKPIVSKISGKLITILVNEDQLVDSAQNLAYLESTANHEQVLQLLSTLKTLQKNLFSNKPNPLTDSHISFHTQLGELQLSYQTFYEAYLAYRASIEDGMYLRKKAFLQKELSDIQLQRKSLLSQKSILEKEYNLALEEYNMYASLHKEKVIATAELRKQEGALLARQSPLEQTNASILANGTSYTVKEKEIMELDNQIREQKAKFIQALNSLVSESEEWKNRYVLSASIKGKVSFAGIIQPNHFINANQDVFYLDPGNGGFCGTMDIPQYNMGKVKRGQEVLIKLKSYPYEEYGIIKGEIDHIAEIPLNDSIFKSRVILKNRNSKNLQKTIVLKIGMVGDAEIITENASLLIRLSKNIIKVFR